MLWGRRELLDQLPPFLGGGEMIETVTMERSTYAGIPHKFEAGTPPIVEAVGLGAAVDYLTDIGLDNDPPPRAGRHRLPARRAGHASPASPCSARSTRPSAGERSPSRSTACTRTTSPRCSTRRGIAVRAGHHCAKPAHERFGVQSSTRASSYLYTTPAEIDALIEGINYTKNVLQGG